ncbi:MAG TPA: sulfite dehydrogenase [Gemmatimonadaceae bacterium]|nr:sulfite dehydrogenase [Gemmatimonadaceae bacterium]
MSDERPIDPSRRALLGGAAAMAAGALLKQVPVPAQSPAPAPGQPTLAVPDDPTAAPGPGTTAISVRSPFETPARTPTGVVTGSAFSPIHQLTGTITPSDLMFERHHAGVAVIDPAKYELLVHGFTERAMVFTLDDLKRFPSVSRVHFLECSGNGRVGYRDPKAELSPQMVDGLTSNGEWTGVPLATLFREVGVRDRASWFLAEGGDAAKLSRSIPIAKGWDDALVVYAFNGEPLRPANGYPVRLFLPGYEANTCVKWLRRIELIDQPNMSRDETSKYTDPLPDGTARQFSFVMDAKSTITEPAFPARIPRAGWVQISGIAWSGRGRIARVDVSTDGGKSWSAAELQAPVLAMAHTRFRMMWEWDGRAATLMSRAVDETGYVQPTLAAFQAGRGRGTDFHFNHIRAWSVQPDGRVFYGAGA